ncbi:MAG: acetolactate synthase large subunit [Thermoflexus sp.]|uniref:thiamine pyrophosphate-binding protein n=1 Tax=Thermoflexus sp. TaxID=1969742 RepID=UPI0033319851
MNGATLLVESLQQEKVPVIFGLPGDEVAFFEALRGSSIRFITVRHEQAAAFMADAYGRLAGRPGVCFSTLGPGATNLATGLANALLDRSPVVALSDQVSTDQMRLGVHQYVDLAAFFQPITKWSAVIRDPELISPTLHYAFQVARAERPGPVHLSLPANVLERECFLFNLKAALPERALPLRPGPDPRALQQIAAWLQEALAPVLLVGNLPLRAGAAASLRRFVEAYQIPTLTTYMGKGALPEDHPLCLGVISRHARGELMKLFAVCDLIMTIGYDEVEGVKPALWTVGNHKRLVSIDSVFEAEAGGILKSDLHLAGDLHAILEGLTALAPAGRRPWLEVPAVREAMRKPLQEPPAESAPLSPGSVTRVLGQVLPEDAVIAVDVGLNKYAMGLGYRLRGRQRILFSNGLSAMGFALPAALGARCACPDAPIVAVSGDGGFLMNVQELETSLRHRLPVVAVVLRDNALGLIRRMQVARFGAAVGTDLGNPDLPALAAAFGARGITVESADELADVLSEALPSGQTWVVDVPVSYEGWLQ